MVQTLYNKEGGCLMSKDKRFLCDSCLHLLEKDDDTIRCLQRKQRVKGTYNCSDWESRRVYEGE